MEILGNIVMIIGFFFMVLGIFGVFRFDDFFSRILITAKVDTVGFITMILGLILKNGLSYFSWKMFLILALYVVTNPISTHALTRSAYLSGYRIKKEG